MPLYSARMPPSVLYIVFNVAHMPGSCFRDASPREANEADWMESLVRTMSNGYVNVTEVIPAAPPHRSRLKGERSAPGEGSANWTMRDRSASQVDFIRIPVRSRPIYKEYSGFCAYPFVKIIASKLYG